MNPLQKQTPTKEDEGGGKEEKLQAEEMKAKEANNISCQNNLELRLGVSSSNSSSSIFKERLMDFSACSDIGLLMTHLIRIHDPKSMHGLEPWLFADPPTRFIDPWSLAARQQKAVLEQAHRKTTNPSATTAPSQDLA
ncbi:auxin-responsive protein IAA27-like, partial [Dendrobium catenatum]